MYNFYLQANSDAVDYMAAAQLVTRHGLPVYSHKGIGNSPIRIEQQHSVLTAMQDTILFPSGFDGTISTGLAVPQSYPATSYDHFYQQLIPYDTQDSLQPPLMSLFDTRNDQSPATPRLNLYPSYPDNNCFIPQDWLPDPGIHQYSSPDNIIQAQDIKSLRIPLPYTTQTTANPTVPLGDAKNPPDDPVHCCGGGLSGPHYCSREGSLLTILCLGSNNCSSVFTIRNDFNRHCNTVHMHARNTVRKLLDCPNPNCTRVGKKGFNRSDNLLQHRRLVHHEDIPKVGGRFRRVRLRGLEPKMAIFTREKESCGKG